MTGRHNIRVYRGGRLVFSRRAAVFEEDAIIVYLKDARLIEKEAHYFDAGVYFHEYHLKPICKI